MCITVQAQVKEGTVLPYSRVFVGKSAAGPGFPYLKRVSANRMDGSIDQRVTAAWRRLALATMSRER
jgi:hypothetical protein